MAKALGRSYKVEPGVSAFYLKAPKGHSGHMVSLTIGAGVEHWFTPEILGPKVVISDGRAIRTDWALEDALLLVSALPEVVRARYRLDGITLVCVRVGGDVPTADLPAW